MESGKLNAMKQEMRQKQIEIVKAAVQLTYDALDELEKIKNEVQAKIKVLKHDLYDLKDGRLDRILERQTLDNSVNSISVFSVSKIEGQSAASPWYVEYNLTVPQEGKEPLELRINNATTKTHASGSYKLKSGNIKYL